MSRLWSFTICEHAFEAARDNSLMIENKDGWVVNDKFQGFDYATVVAYQLEKSLSGALYVNGVILFKNRISLHGPRGIRGRWKKQWGHKGMFFLSSNHGLQLSVAYCNRQDLRHGRLFVRWIDSTAARDAVVAGSLDGETDVAGVLSYIEDATVKIGL